MDPQRSYVYLRLYVVQLMLGIVYVTNNKSKSGVYNYDDDDDDLGFAPITVHICFSSTFSCTDLHLCPHHVVRRLL